MIKSFKDDETEKIYNRLRARRLPSDIQKDVLRRLRMMNNAVSLTDLRIPPANRLEKLRGDRKGQHSIRINERWRICFKWFDENAYEVEIVDYHK